MIISHLNKFIFIHIFKAAGNNIRTELRDYSYTKSKKNSVLSTIGIYPKIFSGDYSNHTTASQLQKGLPEEIFYSYFKFAFVRNPWAWQVSLYHFMKQNPTHHQYWIVKNLSFEEYLDWRVNEDIRYQKDFICDGGGNLIVDFVGKVEDIQNDFDKICERVNIPKRKLTVRNQSFHKSYQEYYSDPSKKMIEEVFREDIKLFGYSFDS